MVCICLFFHLSILSVFLGIGRLGFLDGTRDWRPLGGGLWLLVAAGMTDQIIHDRDLLTLLVDLCLTGAEANRLEEAWVCRGLTAIGPRLDGQGPSYLWWAQVRVYTQLPRRRRAAQRQTGPVLHNIELKRELESLTLANIRLGLDMNEVIITLGI